MSLVEGIGAEGSIARTVTPQRRFQLADAMILVAAAAVGFGAMCSIARVEEVSPHDWCALIVEPVSRYDLNTQSLKIRALILLTMPTVAAATPAVLAIRLIGPRPRFRRLARQPGLAASCAVALATACVMLPPLIAALVVGAHWDDLWGMLAHRDQVLSTTLYGGVAVLVSWTTLVVGGWRRAEAGWIDRFGRVLGFYWIAAAFAVLAANYLEEIAMFHCMIRISPVSPIENIGRGFQRLGTLAMPPAATATLILLSIRSIGFRSRGRRLARQPGLTALYSSGLAMGLLALEVLLLTLAVVVFVDGGGEYWEEISRIRAWLLSVVNMTEMTKCGGFAVLVSWATSLVGRGRRAERCWIDRLGRAVGFCWILAAFLIEIGDALIMTYYYF